MNALHITIQLEGLGSALQEFRPLLEKLLDQPKTTQSQPAQPVDHDDIELTTTQTTRILGRSKPTLRKLVAAGKLEKIGEGKQTRYSREQVLLLKTQLREKRRGK